MKLTLPDAAGRLKPFRSTREPLRAPRPKAPFPRIAFAAAHVIPDPLRPGELDWKATLAFRRHLLGLGFNIAEAMDTSQRGMGLDWRRARELITRSLDDAGDKAARIASGCGTDQLDPAEARSLDDVVRAYLEQLHAIQRRGGRVILMASRALARVARSREDYRRVYRRVLAEADKPVILHWLGAMFDPALAGYWGAAAFPAARDSCLAIIGENFTMIDGIKISLLDARKEIDMRRRLPAPVKMYTGDDFNYPGLIAGDRKGFSHALLGIFDAIAPAASLALTALGAGDTRGYNRLLDPTVPLSRRIFETPTFHYKTGIVFLAWLNGHQSHFVMVDGAQSRRSIIHLADVFRLAAAAGLLRDPDLAAARMGQLLAVHGLA